MFNVFICSSYQRGMRPILHYINIFQHCSALRPFSWKTCNQQIQQKSGKRICLTSSKMKYRVLFSNHMKAMAVKKGKKDLKYGSFQLTHTLNKKKQRKTKPTHPCSPRQVLLSRSTSPPWLDPRQTSLTVVPRQLFLTCVQKWGCRLQRQRWCQQQGGGRRQRQWWQLGLRHKWWFKIFQLLEIAASLECLTSSFHRRWLQRFLKNPLPL